MSDSNPLLARPVAERHRAMTPTQRCLAAASLVETARAIVDSSLAPELEPEQRRSAIALRFYRRDLPEAALIAHARFQAPDVDAAHSPR